MVITVKIDRSFIICLGAISKVVLFAPQIKGTCVRSTKI